MYNFITWQQIAFLLDHYPIGTYERYPSVRAEIGARIDIVDDQSLDLDRLRWNFSEMIHLHRIAFALSQVHDKEVINVLESYEYWANRGKDLEKKKGVPVLPEYSDILTCPRGEVAQILLHSFRLLPDNENSLSYKLTLIDNLKKIGWEKITQIIWPAIISESSNITPVLTTAKKNKYSCYDYKNALKEITLAPNQASSLRLPRSVADDFIGT